MGPASASLPTWYELRVFNEDGVAKDFLALSKEGRWTTSTGMYDVDSKRERFLFAQMNRLGLRARL
jgi:hypothetical protein